MAIGRVYLKNPDTLVLDSPYDSQEVVATKKIYGAKWDKINKVWEFPVTSLAPLLTLARNFGHEVDNILTDMKVPEHSVGLDRVELGSKLEIYFVYDAVKVSAMQKIPGAKWDKTKWVAPLSALEDVLAFAERFGLELNNEAELKEMKRTIEDEGALMQALSHAESGSIEIEAIDGELFPYQKAGVEYALRAKKTFIADEVGLGKTIQAIATMEVTGAFPVVVSAPPSLLLNWKREISKFAPHRKIAIVENRKELPEKGYDYLIVGDSNIKTWEKELKGHKGYIFDESQRFKRYEAQRTKAAIDIAKKGEVVLLLTGTPITNRPAEFAAQLQIIDRLKEFGGKWAFYKRYARAHQDRFGKWDISGAANLPELNEKLRSLCYIRRTKSQVLQDLPEVRKERLHVSLEDAARSEYRKAEADIVSYLAEKAARIARELGQSPGSAAVRARIRASSAEDLVKLATLRRLAALGKLPAINEWIEERVESGVKVVVGAHHRDVVNAIARKWGNVKIQGGMKNEEIEENKRKFQEGDAPVMVISIQAGGTGHTLTAAQDCLIAELPWMPSDVDQLIGRLHRIGQKGSVLGVEMVAEQTIDQQMMDLLDRKARIVKAATEGENIREQSLASDVLMSLFDMADLGD